MNKEQLYDTGKSIYIISSERSNITKDCYYRVIMDYTSTLCIENNDDKLVPLPKLEESGVKWRYGQ